MEGSHSHRRQPGVFSADASSMSRPFVVDGALEDWPSSQWTVDSLAQALDSKAFRCRLMQRQRGQRAGPAWESEGMYLDCRLQDFSDWCRGEATPDNPLAAFCPRLFSAYIDYKYMAKVFEHRPDLLKDVQWGSLGLGNRDGRDSTLWVGSEGASTPCHYDTYGFNLVVQIQGRKRWVLFPPQQASSVYPTRVPYEESSVFSRVDMTCPDATRFHQFMKATPVVITLDPGQVLYVPRHWWHYVTCLETAVSVNTWVEQPADRESRVQEAVTRLLASALIPYLSHTAGPHMEDAWINPTEELEAASSNIGYLKTVLSSTLPSLHTTADGALEKSNPTPLLKETPSACLPSSKETEEREPGVNDNRESSGTVSKNQRDARLHDLENPHLSTGKETEVGKSSARQSAEELRLTSGTEKEKCSDGGEGDGDDSDKLSDVGRALRGLPVYSVLSPFSLSEFLKGEGLKVDSPSTSKRCGGTNTDTVSTTTHNSGSPKRKHSDSEHCNNRGIHNHQVSKINTPPSQPCCDESRITCAHSECSPPQQKRLCRERTDTLEMHTKNAQNCSKVEADTIFPQTSKSQVSIYCPQPCSAEVYMRMLEVENRTDVDEEEIEEVKEEEEEKKEEEEKEEDEEEEEGRNHGRVEMRVTSQNVSDVSFEEAVLKSVLHPDIVKVIVAKLREEMS